MSKIKDNRQLELFPAFDSSPGADEKGGAKTAPPPKEAHYSGETVVDMAPFPLAEVSHRQTDALGHALTREVAELLTGIGLEILAGRVSVVWNQRMRTAAGRAYYEAARIELNPELLKLTEVDAATEIDRTLKHELAHLIAHHRAGGRRIQPHGAEWQQACVDLGIPDEARCHSLPLRPRHIRRKLLYVCPSCGLELRRVRKFKRPVACLDCCRKNSGGLYDGRFRLRLVRTE